MTTDYQVTPAEVSAAAASCSTTAERVQTQLEQLKKYVVSLEDSWQGIASTTFQELMRQYDVYANMLHSTLVDIASGLHGTEVNYSSAEEANLAGLRALGVDLPPVNIG